MHRAKKGGRDYARKGGRDPHRVAKSANEAVEVLGKDNPQARQNFQQLYQNLGRAQTAEEQQAPEQALIKAYRGHQPRSEQERGVVRRGLESLGAEAAAVQAADVSPAQAAAAPRRN